jgi:hypothetical protein
MCVCPNEIFAWLSFGNMDMQSICIYHTLNKHVLTVDFLRMLAVMTLNVGYFMSVVAGAFFGELAFGRFYQDFQSHH